MATKKSTPKKTGTKKSQPVPKKKTMMPGMPKMKPGSGGMMS